MFHFGGVGGAIDWAGLAAELSTGDLRALPPGQAEEILRLAQHDKVVAFARRHGLDPVAAALGLLAAAQRGDRAAARVAKAILDGVDAKEVWDLLEALGITDAGAPA